MSYIKQTHVAGQKLTAAQLNYMENGIVAAQNAYNLLDNSDFGNPVNQRGEVSGAKNWLYFIDRWLLAAVDGTPVHFDINSAYHAIGFNADSGSDVYLVQRFPCGALKEEVSYTFAYEDLNGAIYVGTPVLVYGNEFIQFAMQVKSGTYLKWAALYEGEYTIETLPAYMPKGYSVELVECQRYYYELDTLVGTVVGAARRVFITIPAMRIMPTINYAISGGVAPQSMTLQSINTLDIMATEGAYSHVKVKLTADL